MTAEDHKWALNEEYQQKRNTRKQIRAHLIPQKRHQFSWTIVGCWYNFCKGGFGWIRLLLKIQLHDYSQLTEQNYEMSQTYGWMSDLSAVKPSPIKAIIQKYWLLKITFIFSVCIAHICFYHLGAGEPAVRVHGPVAREHCQDVRDPESGEREQAGLSVLRSSVNP